MLGWPLSPEAEKTFSIEIIENFEDDLCDMFRIQMTLLEGLKSYAILFIPKNTIKPSVTLFSHGGNGTPELCAEFFQKTNYNDMIRRLLRKGNAVLAPQLLLWENRFGSEHNRLQVDNELKQLGSSITAVEIFCFQRWIDYLFTRKDICAEDLTMAGLSYGGFYTLFTAASDVRIKSAYSSCFFNDRYKYSWYDWTWYKAGLHFFDAEIAGLVCPRRLYIEIAANDEIFTADTAEKDAKRAGEFYETEKAENNFIFNVFEGYHEFDKNDSGLNFLLNIK